MSVSQVQVRVEGTELSPPSSGRAARLVLLGVTPSAAPWLGQRLPRAVVRRTRFRTRGAAVEHLRLGRGSDLSALPGLCNPHGRPSLLRDSVALAMAAGAPEVDVLMVRGDDWRAAWDVDELDALAGPFLDDLPGALVCVPDAAGLGEGMPTEAEGVQEALRRLRKVAAGLRAGLVERLQVGLFDLPPGAEDADGLHDADLVLCAWRGSRRALAVQGWRSGAAAIGGALVGQPLALGVAGLRLSLGPGRGIRYLPPVTEGARSPVHRPGSELGDEQVAFLDLDNAATSARVRSEPTLRAPVGAWSLPTLRTVKAIHLAVMETARRYVFRRVVETEAFSLALAMQAALEPFVALGLLVGPDGAPGPVVDGDVVRDPTAPGLSATVVGQLRPWCRTIRVSVQVQASGEPVVEVGP